MGSLIAFFVKRIEDTGFSMLHYKRASRLICVLTIITQVASVRIRNGFPLQEILGDYYANSLLLAVHLFLMLIGAPNEFTEWLSESDVMRSLGKYSFGVYLFHIDVLNTFDVVVPGFKRLLFEEKMLIIFVVSCVVAYVFFHAVERPMIKLATGINQHIGKFRTLSFA